MPRSHKEIAKAAGFALHFVQEGEDDGGFYYWYTPMVNIDDPLYREGDVITGEEDAWRDCCEKNGLSDGGNHR